MNKYIQIAPALLAASFLLAAPVRADDRQAKSPEEVFSAFAAAAKKDDVKVMMSQMTRDSQAYTVGGIWFVALLDSVFYGFMNDRFSPQQKQQYKTAIYEVMKRHGLSEDAMKRIFEKIDMEKTADAQSFAAIGELVKDKPGFIKDIRMVSRDAQELASGFNEIAAITLKEVTINRHLAEARATFPGADGKEKAATVYFKLEDGAWRIDLTKTDGNWPPPPQVQQSPQEKPSVTNCEARPGLWRCLFPRLRGR